MKLKKYNIKLKTWINHLQLKRKKKVTKEKRKTQTEKDNLIIYLGIKLLWLISGKILKLEFNTYYPVNYPH